MPKGFEKLISKAEFADLLEVLTMKSKYVLIPLDRVATVVATRGQLSKENSAAERLVFGDWKPKEFEWVPFVLVNPSGETTKNAVMLNGPNGEVPPIMPNSVALPCNTWAKAVHFLSGVGEWSFPGLKGTVRVIVRLHYADGKTEDHELKNGVQFAVMAMTVETSRRRL